jgi:hypothetical protein
MTSDEPTLDRVFALATHLSPVDKLRLIERLVPQVTRVWLTPAVPVPIVVDDQLRELEALIIEAANAGRADQDSADLISQMRR